MQNKKIQNIIFLSVLVVIFIIMFSGAKSGKILFGTDTINIYLAFKTFAKEMFTKHGDIPLWLPNIFMGIPLIASSSLLYYYPTDLVFMILPIPSEQTYTLDIIIHMFIAALGMFLFLRRINLRKESAFFGGIAFMLSGFLISYIYVGHWNNIKAGALIPFAFYFIHRALSEKKLFFFLSSAIIMALQILATGMQIMAYTFMGIFLYVLYYIMFEEKDNKEKVKLFSYFSAATLMILLFSALQFFPSLAYKNHSWRGDFSYEHFVSWSFHPAESLTFLFPQFYGLMANTYWGRMPFNLTTYYMGLIPFLLIPFVFASGKYKKVSIFLLIASGIFLILSFGGFTPIYKMFYHIPVFNQFRVPSRFLYLFTFF